MWKIIFLKLVWNEFTPDLQVEQTEGLIESWKFDSPQMSRV